MKALITLILSALILLGSSTSHQVKIIEKIFSEISIGDDMRIWSDNKNILSTMHKDSTYKTVDSCEDANLLIIEKIDNLSAECSDKYIFTLNYSSLTKIDKSFGALFWKKGRPNIVIIEPRIKKQHIKISKSLEPYLEEKIW